MPTFVPTLLLTPPAPLGEDVVIDLTGPTDPSGWGLAVYAGYAPGGPVEGDVSGTVAALGDDDNTIRVTIPAAITATLAVHPAPWLGGEMLYLEVWRTDPGSAYMLRRLALPYFDPVREPG